MRPVLLLVDDDRTVLTALRIELQLTFSTRCDIEAFDDPLAVIESLPRWRETGQKVALAVVDQRMPKCSGIELIRRMRDPIPSPVGSDQPGIESPAATARTVLLTAYGGPDVFQAATGEGGVDLYREKPWSSTNLRRDLEDLLDRGPRLVAEASEGLSAEAGADPPGPETLSAILSWRLHLGDPVTIEPEAILDLLAGRLSEPAGLALRAEMDSHPELRFALLGLLLDLERRDSAETRAAFSQGDVHAALGRILARLPGDHSEPGKSEGDN